MAQTVNLTDTIVLYVYKYVGQKGSPAILAIKRSPEVNLRSPLRAGDEARQWRIHSNFEN